ncbi:vascular endothelial growth factor A-like [Lethenteron reissneri]|uniref:vascular endothelial growth factor A-like n=1 Tax=Lethenteron reissneri TaxID=7753 RepID=UPI002AB7D483|nr:vascular endothelial growth factor A-like [Lethenteron reissneri]
MNAVCIVLTVLLFPSSVKPMSVSSGQSHLKNGVMKFDEVMRRSYCQPMETMIDILHEYPDEVEHFFRPSCVPLLRCSGCCNDENQECLPTETANITLQVYKYKLRHNAGYEEMSFQQHTKCECRSRERQKSPSLCKPCAERRLVPDPDTCKCLCKLSVARCKHRGQELNEHSCRCERPRR